MKDSFDLHNEIRESTNLFELLDKSEKHTIAKFHNLLNTFPNITLRIGRNFTNWTEQYSSKNILPQTWVNVISSGGEIPNYPKDVYIMSGMGIEPLIEWINLMQLDFKEDLDILLGNALQGVNWLTASPFNNKKATRHPLEKAHQWWAEYILKSL